MDDKLFWWNQVGEDKMQRITKNYPAFTSGIVLKAKRLEQLNNQAFILPTILLGSIDNGILTGCEIDEKDGHIIMHPGVISIDRQVYLLDKEIILKSI